MASPSITGSGQPDEDEESSKEWQEEGGDRDKLDAQTNTTNTEPLVLTCSVCKQQMSSAWTLMQHIQVTFLVSQCKNSLDLHCSVLLQLQHGLSLASDHKLRSQQPAQDPFLYQKVCQVPGLSPGPGVLLPPHFQGAGQFPGLQFRGFPHNFGAGRLPPIRWKCGKLALVHFLLSDSTLALERRHTFLLRQAILLPLPLLLLLCLEGIRTYH